MNTVTAFAEERETKARTNPIRPNTPPNGTGGQNGMDGGLKRKKVDFGILKK